MARKMKVPKFIVDGGKVIANSVPKVPKPAAGLPKQCAQCRFYSEGIKCRAFPEGIPKAILSGRHNHKKPYPNDRGFQFDPAP